MRGIFQRCSEMFQDRSWVIDLENNSFYWSNRMDGFERKIFGKEEFINILLKGVFKKDMIKVNNVRK